MLGFWILMGFDLDLISQRFEEATDEGNASAQLLVTELAQEREQTRRFDGGFVEAIQRFTSSVGNGLQDFGIDGCEHLSEDDGIAHGANGLIGVGCFGGSSNDVIGGLDGSAEEIEDSVVVHLLEKVEGVEESFGVRDGSFVEALLELDARVAGRQLKGNRLSHAVLLS
jgi:hypothetical protein